MPRRLAARSGSVALSRATSWPIRLVPSEHPPASSYRAITNRRRHARTLLIEAPTLPLPGRIARPSWQRGVPSCAVIAWRPTRLCQRYAA